MRLLEYMRLALDEIWQNKMRTFLTLIGIIIGIAAVIVIVVLVQGAQRFFLNEFRKLTPLDIVRVYPRYNSQTKRLRAKLSSDIIEWINQQEQGRVLKIAPRYQRSGVIRYQGSKKNCYIYATTADYYDIYNLELAQGRFLTALDNQQVRETVVLGYQAAKDLFKLSNPLGKKVLLDGTTYTVIGVLKEQPQSMIPASGANRVQVFIPLRVQERLAGIKNRYSLAVQVKSASQAAREEKRLQTLLNLQYGKTNRGDSKFWVRRSLGGLLKQLDIMKLALLILLGGAASITLLVAGIGVMNIMLVIVTERTREIGLRKAIGATKRDILAQFIIEAVLLCLVGGVLGISGGYLISNLIGNLLRNYVDIKIIVPGWAIVVSLLFTTGVGVFFGFYPALKAARKDPVEALRYE